MIRSNHIASHILVALAAASLALTGCGKKEEDKKQDPAAAKPAEKPVKKPADTPPVKKPVEKPADKPAATAGADYVRVIATHSPATPSDPVTINIEKFAVKSAKFDAANLEGATAELELDFGSIKSDKGNRDGHLKTPDYLDVGQFATATVKIADVKKKDDKNYTANAEVVAHGVTKKLPVTFTVLENKDGAVKVMAKQEFDRLDFGIGKEPDGKNEKVSKKLTIEMQLTLKNT